MLQLLPPALRLHFEASAGTNTMRELLFIERSALRDKMWFLLPMQSGPSAAHQNLENPSELQKIRCLEAVVNSCTLRVPI
jgi:hypothetical protein